MKLLYQVLLLSSCILFSQICWGQNPVKTFSLSTGYTTNKSWINNLSYEFSKNGYNRWGAQVEQIIHYEEANWNKNIYSLGLFYKRQFASSKNFSANWMLGGAAGTDNTDFYYFPFVGLEQVIYPNQTFQFFIAQKATYIININKSWQPSLNAGLKISL